MLVTLLLVTGFPNTGVAAPPDFNRQIAPLLAARCLECHAGGKTEGDLDLSQLETAQAGGESGAAIVAGKLGESLAWERIEADEMPPKHSLTAAEKQLLKHWIEGGAVWDTDPIDRFAYTTDVRAGYDWWSLQPLKNVELPAVKRTDWQRNEIDRFVLHRLEANGLAPSPEAEPRVLIRRLYFDLVGLPPTPEQVKRFVANPSDAAYDNVVEELLASPHYGERWGRHWLDVARYGESHGFERNDPRYNAWHYRDWVIEALNADMPYDEFARMQIAGDIIAKGHGGEQAVGFLVAGVHNTVVGSSQRMKLLARQDELEEIAGTVSQTFLGLTVNCARCHDHKFDPITAKEYYQFIAALDGVQHGERQVELIEAKEEYQQLTIEIAQLSAKIEAIDASVRKKLLADREETVDGGDDLPRPYAAWEFEGNLRDSVGQLHGEAFGQARVENGALILGGSGSYVRTAPIDQDVTEKTLVVRVNLEALEQRGGAAISLETGNGVAFDAIVFGEREPHRWMAGSDAFRRTRSFNGPAEESAVKEPVQLAFVYASDGTITAYRNGEPYGSSYQTGSATFKAENGHVLFGLRHLPAGGNKFLAGKILDAQLYTSALPAEVIPALFKGQGNYVSEKSIMAALQPTQAKQRRELVEKLTTTRGRRQTLAQVNNATKIHTVNPRNPGAMKVHIRGSVESYGDEVTPGGIASIVGVSGDFQLSVKAFDSDRRRALAHWITDENNPLFNRVIVNRVWHYHFGQGLVPTPSDLGFSGGQPSHPELVDWLANSLRADDYQLKALHRRIVRSATYRQASATNQQAIAKDAGNRLLWRYSPRRVEAEVLRDSILKIAGQLNPRRGGQGYVDVKVVPNKGTNYYQPIDPEGEAFNRRTIYRFSPRGERGALLDTFDCPDPSATAPTRSVTTTPLQALSLLNNSFVLRMSDKLAERVQQQAGNDASAQADLIWWLVLCRAPDQAEQRLAVGLIAEQGLPALARALFNCNEFVYIE